jgi:hypothetical protein
VLLRPLPHPDAHRLVALFERNTETGQKHLVSPFCHRLLV